MTKKQKAFYDYLQKLKALVADRYEKVLTGLDEALKTKESE